MNRSGMNRSRIQPGNLLQASVLWQSLLLLCLLLAGSHASAQNNYAAFELRREDNWSPLLLEDLNGDQLLDLVYAQFDPDFGRELFIHHQRADGTFSSDPQRVEIKTEIIAIAFADLRPSPGKELVLFANAGVFSLSTQQQGYGNNLKLLFEWNFLAAIPDRRRVRFTNLATDINADGLIDLLVPGDDVYGLFLGRGDEQFELALELTTLNQDITPIQRQGNRADVDANLAINADEGVRIEINIETPTPFQGFVEQWQDDGETGDLLNSEQWMPTPVLARLNADSLPDLAYVNAGDNGLGQMNLHFQNADSDFAPVADWSSNFDSTGDFNLLDLDGDGLDDLMRLDGDGNDWTLRLFRNRGGSFELATPDQVMRFSGYDTRVDLVTTPDGSRILTASYYTIPVVDAIRNASINRVQLLYDAGSAEPGQLFGRRPVTRLEESFSADTVRGLSELMSLRYDVDGDGRNDALYVTANGTLAAKTIDEQLQIAAQPFWEYVSPRTVFEFEVLDLNSDERPDLLLRHGTSTTLLVARP